MKRLTSDQWMGVGLGVMAAGVLALALLDTRGARDLLPPGEPMPEVAGPLAGGGEVHLPAGDTGGTVLLLDFWTTWCPACVRAMPTLETLESELGPEGLQVLTVNLDEAGSREEQERIVRAFLEEQGVDIPVLLDDGRLRHTFKAYSLPTIYLVGRDGLVRRAWSGAASKRALEREIRAALDAGEGR